MTTGRVEQALTDHGLRLPLPLVLPKPNRRPFVLIGSLLYLSGHGAALLEEPGLRTRGKVPNEVSEEDAYAVARAIALKMIATMKHATGDLDRVEQVVKLVGIVNAHPDFERSNVVIDGASDLFFSIFGPKIGCHARSTFGVASLVGRQCVEIEAIIQIRSGKE